MYRVRIRHAHEFRKLQQTGSCIDTLTIVRFGNCKSAVDKAAAVRNGTAAYTMTWLSLQNSGHVWRVRVDRVDVERVHGSGKAVGLGGSNCDKDKQDYRLPCMPTAWAGHQVGPRLRVAAFRVRHRQL